MKKIVLSVLALLTLSLGNVAFADEGMWLLSLIGKNYEDMKQQGFKLTPEDIYNVNNGCLKDAVVGLGNGTAFRHFCTGEIVSDQGLMMTNHHCGYSSIQAHSTIEHDYLLDGFWAYSQAEELSNPGMTASVLVRVEDVSEKVLAKLNDDMSKAERQNAEKAAFKEIVSKAVAGTDYKANVSSMFGGNQYFLMVYIVYQDVRLVGAPPSSMGKFGGDTDNWMWPRHTCDFSMFRIYTDKDGKPAKYSKNNVPLKPKHHLPISIKGVEDGDFAMIMGFPGTTNRYISSYGLEEMMNVTNRLRYEIRDVKVNVLRKDMAADQKVKIQYASKYASCSNYWKYSFEQNKALNKLNTMDIKKQTEEQMLQLPNAKRYKDAMSTLKNVYRKRNASAKARMYVIEALLGTDLPYFAYGTRNLQNAFASGSIADVSSMVSDFRPLADQFYKDYNPQTELNLLKALYRRAYDSLDVKYYPEFFNIITKKYKGDVEKYIEQAFSKSIFSTKEKFEAFLNKPNAKSFANDPIMAIATDVMDAYRTVNIEYSDLSTDLDNGNRIFIEGIMKLRESQNLAPDANSTLRLTYGKVGSYGPRDAVVYDHYTTLKGVMEKENPNSTEFMVPQRLKDLYNAKDFGQYTNAQGELPTCFITNNDITGGNSGSPVINANGELIGLAFDGNSEAMSGDIDFEENLQRCINLDIRYAMFVIDKYANAQNLIKEMDIRK